MPMTLSPAALAELKHLEGLRLRAYPDRGGVWTIGYGDTGDHVKAGDVITEAEAESRLKRRLVEFEAAVSAAVKRPMTQGQFDALVVLTYNIGIGAFRSSSVLKAFNAADIPALIKAFGRFIKRRGPEIELRRGDAGSQVGEWQRELVDAGFIVKADGDFGPATEAATKQWAAKHGQPVDGVARFRARIVDEDLVARRFAELGRFFT